MGRIKSEARKRLEAVAEAYARGLPPGQFPNLAQPTAIPADPHPSASIEAAIEEDQEENKAPEEATTSHLEILALDFIHAQNTREDFSPDSTMWKHFSRTKFFNESEMLGTDLLFRAKPRMTLEEFVSFCDTLVQTYPAYHVGVKDVLGSVKGDRGFVWMDAEINGVPEGITRPIVVLFAFAKEEDGVWRIVSKKLFAGQGA